MKYVLIIILTPISLFLITLVTIMFLNFTGWMIDKVADFIEGRKYYK